MDSTIPRRRLRAFGTQLPPILSIKVVRRRGRLADGRRVGPPAPARSPAEQYKVSATRHPPTMFQWISRIHVSSSGTQLWKGNCLGDRPSDSDRKSVV